MRHRRHISLAVLDGDVRERSAKDRKKGDARPAFDTDIHLKGFRGDRFGPGFEHSSAEKEDEDDQDDDGQADPPRDPKGFSLAVLHASSPLTSDR